MNFKIDKSKAINSILYILNVLKGQGIPSDLHKVMKLLYFSDREHLVTYGFPITGDTYLKQQFGPVPSFSNYVVKGEEPDFKGIVSKDGIILSTDQQADLDDLSQSEVECLDHAIKKYSQYSFEDLTEISHDHAWNNSDWEIGYDKIAVEGNADGDMLAFINEKILNNNISFS
ncbi:hypothetical protein ASU31_00550 [Pedobacter ginsenosidimutans]|uniref:Antitoxin SocA-like Panacea domain-containing protein n=1 Tax=Pedobacter ginsenosidimutans TaxID=687842 RepID=A0A0T5VVH6_9SPHI|nr:Panacea domain-containing protein [Pedobacter ginsenosidimutans]KRT17821.1 hypothetical protein ASU31_00550 [Pedobacter ginsenosidimutans]